MMTGMTETPHTLYERHADTLAQARRAIRERTYFSAYPESPSPRVYGETAAADGQAAFQANLGRLFPLDGGTDRDGGTDPVATEVSPFGVDLGVSYPHRDPDTLLTAATAALPAWRDLFFPPRRGDG